MLVHFSGGITGIPGSFAQGLFAFFFWLVFDPFLLSSPILVPDEASYLSFLGNGSGSLPFFTVAPRVMTPGSPPIPSSTSHA